MLSRSPGLEEPMSGEWDDECADLVAGEWDHNDAQGRKPKRVPGVSWHKRCAWQVSWREQNARTYKTFYVLDFMKTSQTFCKAEADALCAAIKFRKDLERRGIGKAKRVENPQSNVPGNNWHIRLKAWIVQLQVKGKRLSGGCFKPKDSTPEEVERARLAAVESRRKLEEKCFTIKQIAGPDSSVLQD